MRVWVKTMRSFFLLLLTLSPLLAAPVQDFWFNGAEVNVYQLDQSRYGKNHPGHVELIFVTEPFLIGKQVKNESKQSNSTSVLKLNALSTFNTGVYSYSTMTSTFRPIDLERFPQALKSVTSIQDWCGQAFQQFNYRDKGWQVQIRSYFEAVGDLDENLGSGVLEDELWVTLRLDPNRLPLGNLTVIPGAVFTRFYHQPTRPTNAIAALSEGAGLSSYSLTYPSLSRTLTIQFDSNFPHIIRKWTERTINGITTATLAKRQMNVPYWELNQPEDAARRKSLGLDPVAD